MKLPSAALAALLLSVSAQAAIQDNGDVTYDTETKLYWPDVTLTQGRGYTEIFAEFGPAGEFPGCRFPTQAEIADLVGKLGIPPQQTGCSSGYCGAVNGAYAEQLEDAIRLLGDTRDAGLDASGSTLDVSPDGAGWTLGYYGAGSTGSNPGAQNIFFLRDGEYVTRATGAPFSDQTDIIHTNYGFNEVDRGVVIVCGTWPLTPAASEVLDFEDQTVGTTGPLVIGDYRISGDVVIATQTSGDKAAGIIPCTGGGYCDRTIVVERADGKPFAFLDYTTGGFPGGGILSDCDDCQIWGIMPNGDEVERNSFFYEVGQGEFLAVQRIEQRWKFDMATQATCDPCQFGIDDIEVALARNSEIDFDPYSAANTFRPKDEYLFTIMVETKSIATGDAYDFNGADIVPLTLRVHPTDSAREPASIAGPFATLISDFDGDGDNDYAFGFRIHDTDLDCFDEAVVIAGSTVDGRPFAGRDTIVAQNCLTTGEVDVEPFAPADAVYPDDDYTVLVAVKSLSVADGDSADIIAQRVSTLEFGYGQSASVIDPYDQDIDGDGDQDRIWGFSMQESGIVCGDTELPVVGRYSSPVPPYLEDKFEATGNITTENCDTASCHP